MNTIEDAILALSARDQDYATVQNGIGFNGTDTKFGNSLADQLRKGRTLSPKQLLAGFNMIQKYREQLAGYGIDVTTIARPAPPPEQKIAATLTLTEETGTFVLTDGFDRSMIHWIKQFPGRTYDGETKAWSFPMTADVAQHLEWADPRITIIGREHLAGAVAKAEAQVSASRATDAELELPVLGGELMPFQRAGVAYALEHRQTIIGDEMGLGKTVQALAVIEAAGAVPALVVCPSVVKINWHRETAKWLPGRTVQVLQGRGPAEVNEGLVASLAADVVIVNYDVLESWVPTFGQIPWRTIVFDESHYLKNQRAKRTKAAKTIAKGIGYRLLLTGTPILNRPVELVGQLEVAGVLPRFGGYRYFTQRYCNPRHNGFGLDLNGASNLDELNRRLRETVMVRRLKRDVIEELPEKRRATLPIPLADEERYRKTERDLKDWCRDKARENRELLEHIKLLDPEEAEAHVEMDAHRRWQRAMRAEAMVRIEALKQVAAEEKLPAVLDWVRDLLDTDEKLIVFAHHHNVINAIAEEFSAPVIVGGIPNAERQAAVDRFQDDPNCRLIVIGILAGGVGLTLTAATNVAFVELPWRPGDLDQAEDRAYARLNDMHGLVAWYLLAAGTIDEQIASQLHAKRTVIDAAVDGVETDPSESLLSSLLAHFEEDAA